MRPTDALPDPSPDSTTKVCPRTQRKAARMEKGERDEESAGQGARRIEQIKNRCLHTCESAFQNGAMCPRSPTISPFNLLITLSVITLSFYWKLNFNITLSHFLTQRGDKHKAWADVDTPGNYPSTRCNSKQPHHQWGKGCRDMAINGEIC